MFEWDGDEENAVDLVKVVKSDYFARIFRLIIEWQISLISVDKFKF